MLLRRSGDWKSDCESDKRRGESVRTYALLSVPAFREQIISDENFAEQTEQVTYREGMFMGYRGYETKNSYAVSV